MKLEFYSEEKLKKEILNIVGKYLDLVKYKVFFFGSRVKGDSFPRSDIDIGIEGPKEIPSSIYLDIQEEIENLPTLYKVDIVDFKRVNEKFKEVASQYVELLK